jgi:peptidyl-dipeptidase A
MMGQLFASQVHHTIAKELYEGTDPGKVIYVGDKRIGDFMKKRVFEPGKTLDWQGLTKHATGEPLSPKAFAADFKGQK